MGSTLRAGKSNQALIAIFPIVLILSGLMVYNAYKWFSPDPFIVAKSQRVEALEVLDGFMGVTRKGLPIPQPQTVPRGGSSTLIITHPVVEDGPYQLIFGRISASYMIDKIELDRMLQLRVNANQIKVESGGEAVEATILVPRTKTEPLLVDAPTSDSPEGEQPEYFVNKILLPAPTGTIEGLSFESDNGMVVEGPEDFDFLGQLEFQLDEDSQAWLTMPKMYRVQHTAVGTEDLELAIIIPLDDGTEPFEISMFGEKVATIRRR